MIQFPYPNTDAEPAGAPGPAPGTASAAGGRRPADITTRPLRTVLRDADTRAIGGHRAGTTHSRLFPGASRSERGARRSQRMTSTAFTVVTEPGWVS
ncbi:hypothetical protein GA0115260_111608 [Streptomyces sp. MnatMP-M27]|nr:hypothetical protein GA0115260_111608 [Streptomyces sp. MnatMP-M27]